MKIAEALLLRSDFDSKIKSLRSRIMKYAVVQEGTEPHEDPSKLFLKVQSVIDERKKLVAKISVANIKVKISDEKTISEALLEREALLTSHNILNSTIVAAQKEPDRYSRSEIRWMSTVNVNELQDEVDKIAQKIREINAKIQQANWENDL